MRKIALLLATVLLLALFLPGCISRNSAAEETLSLYPLAFASQFLPYIGKTQYEVLQALKIPEEGYLHMNAGRLTIEEPVVVNGLPFMVALNFSGEEPPCFLDSVWYVCIFETPRTVGAREPIETFFNLLTEQYGEPAPRREGTWTVEYYLEWDAQAPGRGGDYTELWIVEEPANYPSNGVLQGDLLLAEMMIKVGKEVTHLWVGYRVRSYGMSGVVTLGRP